MSLASIEPTALAAVMGGVDAPGSNVDTTESRLGVVRIGRLPIPYRKTTTTKTRSEFGACVDGGVASCERRGGTNETVGGCMLDAVKTCSKRDE